MTNFFVLFFLLCSFYVFSRVSRWNNILNPACYLLLTYVLFNYIAILYSDIYDYALDISYHTIVICTIGLMSISLGVLFASINYPVTILKQNIPDIIEGNSVPSAFFVFIPLVMAISCSFYYIYDTGYYLWSVSDFDDLRVNLRKGRGDVTLLGIASSYISAIYAGIYYKDKSLIKHIFVIFILIFTSSTYGNRAPSLDVIVISGFFVYFRFFRDLGVIRAIYILISLMFILMVMQVLRQGIEFSFESIYKQMLWRPFTNIQNIEWIVNWFPKRNNYMLGGSVFYDLSIFLPGHNDNFGSYLKELFSLDFTGGSITTSLVGQAYIDFGMFGVAIIPFFIGYISQKVYVLFLKGYMDIPTLLVISISIKAMASSYLITPILYIAIPSFVVMYFTKFTYFYLKRE